MNFMKLVYYLSLTVLVCSILSCGSDTEDEQVVEPQTVKFRSAQPENGSIIRPDDSVFAVFFGTPENLTVSLGTLVGTPKSRTTVSGPFPLGDFTIELTWTDGTQILEYTVVPEGMIMVREAEFQMGSDSEDAAENEKPVHTVFVDTFFMDTHEVTVGEYKQFVEATGHREPEWGEIALYAPTDQHPIVYVSWYDAMSFAKWVGKRLPTEAEWEKAARGGSVSRTYPWGNISPDGKQCNFADKNLTQYWWVDKEADDGYPFTAPVGTYPENRFGLFDMSGNVLEWCLDEFDNEFYAISTKDNPISGQNTIQEISEDYETVQSNRVLRGGSWIVTAKNVRNSTRFFLPPESKNNTVGFRCVMDLP